MNRYILCPETYKTRYTDFYILLLERFADQIGATVHYSTEDLVTDPEFLFLFAVPQWDRLGLFMDYIRKLDKGTKVVSYLRDVHPYDMTGIIIEEEVQKKLVSVNNKFGDEVRELFERFNLIISPSVEYFKQCHPEFLDKMEFMPDFFGPYERFVSLPTLDNPTNLCLLSGALHPAVYPIREYIVRHRDPNKIIYIPPPFPTIRDSFKFIGDRYAKLLNKFQCCVTESGIYNYAITKAFEIPAAGSLLICNRVSDMDLAGFIPDKHYLPITKETVFDVIDCVLEDPEMYQEIKQEGRRFVWENHSIEDRLKFLYETVYLLCGQF